MDVPGVKEQTRKRVSCGRPKLREEDLEKYLALPTDQNAMEGSHAPAGALYAPMVIRFAGSTARRPWSRHQRNSAALRVGTRIPGPCSASTAPSSACMSRLLSATAKPKNPGTDANAVIRPS